jgi:EAL domain-containing protein (putative c-di-GMP-specific phosphodiesterase class I)
MPVSTLKIVGCLVRDITTDSVDATMVLAIAQIGQKPGIKTIAEFVENEETLLLLEG